MLRNEILCDSPTCTCHININTTNHDLYSKLFIGLSEKLPESVDSRELHFCSLHCLYVWLNAILAIDD